MPERVLLDVCCGRWGWSKRRRLRNEFNRKWPTNKKKAARDAAVIPLELAACVADYAERLLEQKEAEHLRTTL